MFGYVYETTNMINNKKYIGKCEEPKLNENYLGSGRYLQNAISKYGKENFSVRIIDTAESRKELNEKEISWIAKLNAVESDEYYNISSGGDGGNTQAGFTEEQHEDYNRKRSEIMLGRVAIHYNDVDKFVKKCELEEYLKEGWILGKSDKFKKNVSEKTIIAMANNEYLKSEEYRKKISEGNKGKVRTAEQRQHYREAQLRRRVIA